MTVDIATLAIRIDSTSAAPAAASLDRVRDAGGRAEQQTTALELATRKLQGALALIGVGTGVGAIIRMADEYTKFTAQLRLAAQSQREYMSAVDDVRRIANVAQQDLAATGVLYARIANGTRELGIAQKQVGAVTEVVNLALKVSGATAQESSSAMLQLSQSFASGTLRGEEFNAVNEAAPRLMKALADGIGVPIGALKQMASDGLITSKMMADVLPQSLQKLQEESKQVQTISGAFTVLKNNVMEFTAVQAQSNGMVALLTNGIGLLANNLSLIAGISTTLMAVNVANWLTSWTTKTYERITAAYAQVAAENAVRASSIAAAESDLARASASGAQAVATRAAILISREEAVARLAQARSNILSANAAIEAATAAGAQSFALRTLRLATTELATAESARAAMVAELAILGQQQARVSAQITAATAAQASAQAALTTANAAGAASVGIAGRAMGLLGGPIGIVISLLGLAATAWSVWGSKAAEGNKQAAESFDEAQARIIKGLDEQIAKNEKLLKLQNGGVENGRAERDLPVIDQLAAASKRLNDINNLQGEFAPGKGKSETDVLLARLQVMRDISELTTKMQKRDSTEDAAAAFGPAAQALVTVRERLTGVNKQYLEDLKALQTAREANAIPENEYIALVSKLAKETWAASDAGKDFAATGKASVEARLEAIKSGIEREKNLRAEGLASITELHRQGLASDADIYAAKYVDALKAGDDAAKVMDAEIAALRSYNGKDAAERIANEAKINKFTADRNEALRASEAAAGQIKAAYAYDHEKPARDAQEAANKEIKSIYDLIYATEQQIASYNKLPSEITAATIAELESQRATVSLIEGSEKAVAVIDKKIAAYQRLGQRQLGLQALDTNSDAAKAKELLDILKAVDDAARQAASGMEASFGAVGRAIGSLTTALTGYAVQQQAIAAQLAAIKADPKSGAAKIAQAEIAASKASAQAQIKSYGDMAGAAKGFFSENSKGYKILEGAEKAYRAVEMAMAIESMVVKSGLLTAFTGLFVASKTTEVAATAATVPATLAAEGVKQGALATTAMAGAVAVPFPGNLAAVGIVAAMLAAIGLSGFGGGSGGGKSAADVQKTQGTGSVFGDSAAKSDSIIKSIDSLKANSDLLIPINQGMLTSLQSIEASMNGLTNLVVRTAGITDGSNMGIKTGTLSRTSLSPFASTLAGTNTLGGGIGGGMVGFLLGGPIGAAIGSVLGGVLGNVAGKIVSLWGKTTQNIVDSGLQYGGSIRGLQSGSGFNQYASVDTTKSSWFGLSKSTSNSVQTQGLNDELSRQFGLIFTNLDQALQAASVAMGDSADEVAKVLDGLTLESTKVSLKGLTGTALTDALNSVISKSMDEISSAVFPQFEQFRQVGEGYAETVMRLAGDYAKLDSILAATGSTFGATGAASIAARERVIELAGGIDSLASQTTSFAKNFLTEAEQLAPVQKYVTAQLAAMGLQSLDTRDKFKDYVLGLIASGALATEAGAQQYAALMKLESAFAKVIPAIEDTSMTLESAKTALADAYSAESDAIKSTISSTQDYVKTLIGLRDSMLIGSLSPLTPQEQYAEAARQYEATKAAAMGGDATAQANLSSAMTAFLTASRTVNASSDKYKADFAKTQADLALAIAAGKTQVSTAEASLIALNKQVTGLVTVNESVLSVAAAIKQLAGVMGSSGSGTVASSSSNAIASLYQSLLGRAPDASGLQFWTNQLNGGVSLSAISAAMAQSAEYQGLHGSHANGLSYVPFNGYRAELHEGEGVLTASENLNYRTMGSGLNAALVAEVKALRSEVSGLRADQAKQTAALIISNAQATAQAADKVADATVSSADAAAWADKTAPKVS